VGFDARDWWTLKDTRLLCRAIEQGWPVPAEIRPAIVSHLIAVLEDDRRSARERVRIASVLVKADLRTSLQAMGAELRPRKDERRRAGKSW
jgi:hypothetical protein